MRELLGYYGGDEGLRMWENYAFSWSGEDIEKLVRSKFREINAGKILNNKKLDFWRMSGMAFGCIAPLLWPLAALLPC